MTLRFVVAAAFLAGVASGARAQRSAFPHSRHEKLFPSCNGCHQLRMPNVRAAASSRPNDSRVIR